MAHQHKKRFGQHFLINPQVIRDLVNHIQPQAQDMVIEIGPGEGALTQELVQQVAKMIVVEIDRDLIAPLGQKFAAYPQFELWHQDALQLDLTPFSQPIRLVGNLPYNISSPLIFHVLSQQEQIQDMHFMLQQEVVERLTANPGCRAYGRLSVMVQYSCQVQYLDFIPPQDFDPPPRVDSATVRLVPYAQPPFVANNFQQFAELVRQAFSQKRKMLRNTLKPLFSAAQLESLGVDPTLRPENLSVETYVHLANHL